jgi:dTDP-4-dehydrorhamnose 3,5-epimerase
MRAKLIEQIPGMIEFDLDVHADTRGYFKENFQKAKLVELGLPAEFQPIQNNISFNEQVGVTRGLHAEPWDKYIAVGGRGRVFGAWVDLRAGESFGNVYYTEIDESKALFIPRGVANGFQTLTENTVYTYLVNAHWSPNLQYLAVHLADQQLGIPWPIDLKQAVISEKDLGNPKLSEITAMEF